MQELLTYSKDDYGDFKNEIRNILKSNATFGTFIDDSIEKKISDITPYHVVNTLAYFCANSKNFDDFQSLVLSVFKEKIPSFQSGYSQPPGKVRVIKPKNCFVCGSTETMKCEYHPHYVCCKCSRNCCSCGSRVCLSDLNECCACRSNTGDCDFKNKHLYCRFCLIYGSGVFKCRKHLLQ